MHWFPIGRFSDLYNQLFSNTVIIRTLIIFVQHNLITLHILFSGALQERGYGDFHLLFSFNLKNS